MLAPPTILITGASRGIGFAILQTLATAHPQAQFIATSRSQSSIDVAIQHLRKILPGVRDTRIAGLALDVTSDESILRAVDAVGASTASLDVLVNNAGVATFATPSLSDTRLAYAAALDANVASVANVTEAFLPLLRAAARPLVINISSGRASLTRSTQGALPPTASVPYSVSKAALNALTIELGKTHRGVAFACANPGHCRTGLNGFKGKRDPLEGANVVLGILERRWDGRAGEEAGEVGFWETEGEGRELVRVPW